MSLTRKFLVSKPINISCFESASIKWLHLFGDIWFTFVNCDSVNDDYILSYNY